uniref:CW domain-containing protein n=1 Tax=Caenorhabditis japonica TaxID=281687 RepID=A0A8R1DPF4_CAEJA
LIAQSGPEADANSTCYLYRFGSITSVKKLDEKAGSRVGFKPSHDCLVRKCFGENGVQISKYPAVAMK